MFIYTCTLQCNVSIINPHYVIFTVLGGMVVAVIVTVAVIVAVVACTRLKRRRKTAAQPV